VSKEIADRLTRIFTRDEHGRRAVYDGTEKFQTDPHWRDHILFYEYFHGDNGAGLGASHQTGWTGAVAKLIQLFGSLDARLLEVARSSLRQEPAHVDVDDRTAPPPRQERDRVGQGISTETALLFTLNQNFARSSGMTSHERTGTCFSRST
jgi:hypothetical protein